MSADESADTIVDAETQEIVTDISEGGKRRLRVYDPKGDFVIEVEAGTTVTFGYFNPAAPRERPDQYDRGYGRDNVARQTALRVYGPGAGKKEERQIACFLGVTGFRDLAISITRLRQHVVVETNYEDDGEGHEVFGGHRTQRLITAPEEIDF